MGKAEQKKVDAEKEKQKAEKTKVVAPKTEGSELTDIEQKVFDYAKSLDHPATSNEVRDKFEFPLRAPARRMFAKFDRLGLGSNKKDGKRWYFYVKGKEYPKPREPEPKPKEDAKAKHNEKAAT